MPWPPSSRRWLAQRMGSNPLFEGMYMRYPFFENGHFLGIIWTYFCRSWPVMRLCPHVSSRHNVTRQSLSLVSLRQYISRSIAEHVFNVSLAVPLSTTIDLHRHQCSGFHKIQSSQRKTHDGYITRNKAQTQAIHSISTYTNFPPPTYPPHETHDVIQAQKRRNRSFSYRNLKLSHLLPPKSYST